MDFQEGANRMREGIQLEMAPMEGLTGYVFRNALAKDFPGADVYYTPFLVVNQHHTFKRRERRDVDPRNQIGLSATGKPRLVPQLMASDPDLFLWGCQYRIWDMRRSISMPAAHLLQLLPRGKAAGCWRTRLS